MGVLQNSVELLLLDYANLMIARIRLEVFRTFRACLATSMVKTIFYRLIDFSVQGGRVELAFSQPKHARATWNNSNFFHFSMHC